jgi:uncharacterized membrane protein
MFRWLFQFVLLIALSVWVGSIVFFSIVVAPGIFKNLEREQAGNLLAHLFPHYYLVGTVCGAAALAVLVLLFLFDSGSRGMRLGQMALAGLMLAANLYAGYILEGRIHRLREERMTLPGRAAREEAEKQFQRLHRRSVDLNLAVLGAGGVILATAAVRKRGPS